MRVTTHSGSVYEVNDETGEFTRIDGKPPKPADPGVTECSGEHVAGTCRTDILFAGGQIVGHYECGHTIVSSAIRSVSS